MLYPTTFTSVSESQLDELTNVYAEIITTNKYSELSQFHGEYGVSDSILNALLINKHENKYEIIVEQRILEQGSLTIKLYPLNISDTAYLYVFSAAYTTPLSLYETPSETSPVTLFDNYITEALQVIDVCGAWLKVRFNFLNRSHEGWIPPNEYCSNPESTCN